MVDAFFIIPKPRSAKMRGGFTMFVRAACSRAGTPASLLITRRIRTGAGAFSIVIRLCTPSDKADAYSIGLRRQLARVSCSSSHPSITPSRMRRSTRSSFDREVLSSDVRAVCVALSSAISFAIAAALKSSSRSSCAWRPLPPAIDGCRRAKSLRYWSTSSANRVVSALGADGAQAGSPAQPRSRAAASQPRAEWRGRGMVMARITCGRVSHSAMRKDAPHLPLRGLDPGPSGG